MVQPPLSRVLALARTSLLATAGGTSIQELIERSTPGFGFLQAFFSTWLKIDLTTLAAALTIFGTISGALQDLQGVALKFYWWFTRLFTASISVASSDRLNREILNWVGAQILTRQGTRILTARTEAVRNDTWYPRRGGSTERNDYHHEKRVPIQYLPTFGTTWFIHERSVFMVRRIATTNIRYNGGTPDEYAAAPEGDEPLVVMCLGRSVKPIKKFLDSCRDFAEKQRASFTTVRASKNQYHGEPWDTTILRPIRPLDTVHFDETIKEELVADIRNYLNPNTRQFYNARGIPYRRGYLLHGFPGTGKSSLSLALAGAFALDLYLLHIPSVREDNELERLFTSLPPRCIVLLEDIDAVGIKRRLENEENEDEDEDKDERESQSRCTLSGLLNVLDGVASQEGRIVLMTSNMAHKLDKALVRPGRIDKMILLGYISQKSAELMFLRMFAPDDTALTHTTPSPELDGGELYRLALEFSSQIPDDTFTPAQLQGYLLNHRNSPVIAATEISAWVNDEKMKAAMAKVRAKEATERKVKRRKDSALKLLAKTIGNNNVDIDIEKAAFREGMDEVVKEEATEVHEPREKEGSNPEGVINSTKEEKAKERVNTMGGVNEKAMGPKIS